MSYWLTRLVRAVIREAAISFVGYAAAQAGRSVGKELGRTLVRKGRAQSWPRKKRKSRK